MVVGSSSVRAIFTTSEETETSRIVITQTLEEVLIIGELKRIAGRHISISEREKRRIGVKAFFVHATNSPLPGLLEAATYAFAAGDFQRDSGFGILDFEDQTAVIGPAFWVIGSERAIAGHGLEPDATAHGFIADVFNVCVTGRARERALGFGPIDFVTSH